jgi:hypothetical protein
MSGLIRKIVIGPNPKDAMAYYVGMRAGPREVTAILLDEEYLHRYSQARYLIYVEGDEGTTLWKSVVGLPCMLEYDLNF